MDYIEKTIEFTREEERAIKEYAGSVNMSFFEVIREAIIEKIEDEYDLKMAKESYEEFLKDPTTYTIDEVIKELEALED